MTRFEQVLCVLAVVCLGRCTNPVQAYDNSSSGDAARIVRALERIAQALEHPGCK